MNNRDEIIESFTRTLFVEAYAAFVDELASDGEDTDDMPQAGPGDDWMDAAPVTPDWVTPVALEAVMRIERTWNRHVEQMYDAATKACLSTRHKGCTRHTPDMFGHYLAMQYVGHGVSWGDDHALRIEVPYGESIQLSSRTECGLPEVVDDDDTSGGYTDCACRDCFEIAIGKPGKALCHGCEEHGCEACTESECNRPDAYGCDDDAPEGK